MAEITNEELQERVALLKHFKKLLAQQRAKFQEYLSVLEKQEASIETENADALLAHTELEQQVVKNIANLQKVIVPMSQMYSAVSHKSPVESMEIEKMQIELKGLQDRVLAQNQKNRELLRCHIVEIRTKIENFQNPYRNMASVYAPQATVGKLVEIEA